MNYIKLLTSAFEKFYHDQRLNPSHISLYMALFQAWNVCRFTNEFFVNRKELMQIAKIGSPTTYHRCITDLHSWNYLSYFPSNNPFKGSKVKMIVLLPTDDMIAGHYNPILDQVAEHYRPIDEQVVDSYRSKNGQALVSNININKQNKHYKPPNRKAVIIFFKEMGSDAIYAKAFFEYYESHQWHTGDKQPVYDWKALAVSWIESSKSIGNLQKEKQKPNSLKDENLKTSKNKNYGEPL
ncbi:hypothetical protein C8P64_2098 [Christiangramia gaetbulicola]|uniref:Uncharacterized protein n=1 Tax=Christiangramia gaetbulicola TaxID=703340 RepID=A0A2T6AID8_9FLAO|nr:hypothetical protein [Christiangramia gaetbulicola]PTX43569.1 hypothetical protein C8P64_2098 [Christiangramia gaetbulicola]